MSSSGCIVVYGKSVLLAKRIEGESVPYSGYWSIFAGSREPPAEPPRVCASRELYEEAGISVAPSELNFLKTLYNGLNTFDIFYKKFNHLPPVTLNFEHTEFLWINIADIDTFEGPIDYKILDLIKSIPF